MRIGVVFIEIHSLRPKGDMKSLRETCVWKIDPTSDLGLGFGL